MRGIISRFAPAPTGFLHLGHVVNAARVWRETRARSGTVLLRIEDHDRQRSRPEFEAAILDDLAWLGFAADAPPVRQSERDDIYVQALDMLRRQALVYACDCSRSAIVAARAALKGRATNGRATHRTRTDVEHVTQPFSPPLADNTGELRQGSPKRPGEGGRAAEPELCYPGTCRDRGLVDGPGVGLRVRLEPSIERFDDLRLGPQEQRPSDQCGDLLVRDRDGNWTYQFAATVDDLVQGVTLVVRGIDLLASTGRQIQLARLLGRAEPPAFLHHALIMKSPDQKLSKSDGDTGIGELRARGWTPQQVIDAALAAVDAE
jgi:glutamyl-tRNA synthetase/glutamyl-Q tRNA(Asp) synthetase